MRYWHHIVDDDPQLKREDRKTLQREGTNACEIIASDPSENFTEHGIAGAELSKKSRLSNYRPVLRISLTTSGSGVPRVKLKGRGGVEIEEPRTRCAFVLMHDLQRLLSGDDANLATNQPVTAASPVSLSWVSDSPGVRWPMPPVPTFARQTHFFASIASGQSDVLGSGTEEPITIHEAQLLIHQWIEMGTKLLAGKKPRKTSSVDWGKLIKLLEKLGDKTQVAPSLFREWACDLVLLTMPEACGLELTTQRIKGGLPTEIEPPSAIFPICWIGTDQIYWIGDSSNSLHYGTSIRDCGSTSTSDLRRSRGFTCELRSQRVKQLQSLEVTLVG